MTGIAEFLPLTAVAGIVGVGSYLGYREANKSHAGIAGAFISLAAFGAGSVWAVSPDTSPYTRAVAIGAALGATPNMAMLFDNEFWSVEHGCKYRAHQECLYDELGKG